jgi:hypothetical protein
MRNNHRMSDMEALQVIAAACGEGSQRSNAEQQLRGIQRMLSLLDSQREVLDPAGRCVRRGCPFMEPVSTPGPAPAGYSQLQSTVVHGMQLACAASP